MAYPGKGERIVSLRDLQASAFPSDAVGGESGLRELNLVLRRETKLLTDLLEVLRQQRQAVAAEDLAAVDDTIFSAQRIFRTLAEARLRRRALLEIVGGDPHLPLDEVEEVLATKVTPEVSEALKELHVVALTLAGELEVNRKVLQGAIRSGQELIRVLGGGGSKDAGTYGPGATAPSSPGEHGTIINRRI